MNNRNIITKILTIVCLIFVQIAVFAQERKISGIVTDNNGEPVIGASIMIQNKTGIGTITDIDGKYSIEVSDSDIIEASCLGFRTIAEKVGKRTVIDIVLEVDNNILDDVVVIGYGTAKRANLAGAVSTTDKKTFQSRPSATPTNALQGVLPGVVVNRSSGNGSRPGDEAQIVVRDISSVNGGSPLVLIDGAEGNINSLNPNDIESVSVLKDAQASIYGNRASNGVILITTKSAEEGKVRIDFNAYYAVKTPTNIMQKVSLLEFAEMDRKPVLTVQTLRYILRQSLILSDRTVI